MSSNLFPARRSRWLMLGLILLLWIGFALRAYHLDFQSLWSDEGISLQRSVQPLTTLLRNMPVEQLPGYFVLLHGWLQVAGDQDFGLRFFSLWPSVLALALVYRLGAHLGDRRAGALAALLLAVNPLQLWYAQEARTYSWLMLSALLSTWCFARLLLMDTATPRRRTGLAALGYVAATTLTLYLHFYGFLLPFAHTVFVLGWLVVCRDRRVIWMWVAAGVVIALLFLPWLPRALQIFGFTGWREPLDPWQIPWRFLVAYTVGEAMPAPWRHQLPWLYLVLVGLGTVSWWRRARAASLFLLTQLLIPWLALFLLALRQPDTHERYTLFLAAPLLLLAAGGLSGLAPRSHITVSRWLPRFGQALAGIVVGVLVLTSARALVRYYTDPIFHKPDYRAAAQAIQQNEQPGDVILVDGPDPQIVFLHYYQGSLPVHDLRFLAEAEFEAVDQALSERTVGAVRAWEVLFFHGPGPVQFWLATRGWTVPPTEYNGIRVTLYGLPPVQEGGVRQPMGVAFGPTLVLSETQVTPDQVAAGQPVWVSTAWQVVQPPPDYKFSLRLLDGAGQVVQAQDYGPQNWFTPTTAWPVGQITTDQRGLWLPKVLAPGRYQVALRLYDPTNGVAAETSAGQDVVLREINVTAPP
jgi:4-amino-4-deoxy-L-arabinose transferase-like glycosyltransferase